MSKRTLGVVIARFQAPSLTPAHQYLLEQVATRSSAVLVLLGVAKIPLTKRNPLDYTLRCRMIEEWWTQQWPDRAGVMVLPIPDRPTNEEWARLVDQMIETVGLGGAITIYCGPDGAGPVYSASGGKHPVEVLDCAGGHASRVRSELLPRHTEDFRAGMIYAVDRTFVRPFVTVDAIVRQPGVSTGSGLVLLAHKREDGALWRFPGGFVDVSDSSLDAAVQREVREETGLEVSTPKYICSRPVDDWRYRGGPEKILTTLWEMDRVFGDARAKDDIDDVIWEYMEAVSRRLHPVHQPLWEAYLAQRS